MQGFIKPGIAVPLRTTQPADATPFTELFGFSAMNRLLVAVGADVPEMMN